MTAIVRRALDDRRCSSPPSSWGAASHSSAWRRRSCSAPACCSCAATAGPCVGDAASRTSRPRLPDAVELLVLCIRRRAARRRRPSGELVARAPPPLRPAFAAVDLPLHRGRSLADALGSLGDHAGPLGRDIARAIATADRDGLPLAPVLDRLAADARTARRRLGEAAARRLPVRLTFPLVTCTLPSFVLLAIAPAVLGALSTLRDRHPVNVRPTSPSREERP